VLNNDDDDEMKTESLIRLVGKVMTALQNGKLLLSSQVTKIKINAQPQFVYVDKNMRLRKILIGVGIKPLDISKHWVAMRIASALDSVLVPVGMNSVPQLLFAHELRRRMMSVAGKS